MYCIHEQNYKLTFDKVLDLQGVLPFLIRTRRLFSFLGEVKAKTEGTESFRRYLRFSFLY